MVVSDALYNKEKISNMDKAFDSEERRLKSLREKKQAFKSKEKLVQEALKNLDSKPQSKKIKFDDDITEEQITQIEKKRNTLFDDDSDNDNDEDYNESFVHNEKSKVPKHASEKRLKLQLRYGNDQRFILDDRFDDNDEGAPQEQEETTVMEDNEHDLENEKDWQLNILGDVLGAPVAPKKHNTTTLNKKNRMIRYNPLEKGHEEYEITVDHTKTKPKKKAKRTHTEEVANEDASSIPISKDIYYSVSNKLTDSLKETAKFSLLRTFEKDKPEPKSKVVDVQNAPQNVNKKFQFSVDSSKVFKYDSSDDDDNIEEPNNKMQTENMADKGNAGINHFFKKRDTFFFSSNDPRFNDAFKFFDPNTVSNENFKCLRRELKQIVRAKIRNNVKKNQTWGRKHKVKRS